MQLRHLSTINPASDGIMRVTSMVWSPDNKRLAVVTTDRVVQLFDEFGEKKDRFSTKPCSSNVRPAVFL